MNADLIPIMGEIVIFPFLIPIVAIVMSLLIPIVAIISDGKKKRAIYELHHRERLAAIDKGMEVPALPPELFDGGQKARGPGNYLLRGLIWSAVGIGILIALRSHDEDVATLGVIPLLVGIAYLIYYFVEGRKLVVEPKKSETASAPRV
jgi:hypothetical protein